jgi:hypothetical protein
VAIPQSPKPRGRPSKQSEDGDHRRHHAAVYHMVHELLCFFEEPHTIAEAMEQLNEVILPGIGSAKLEQRAVFKLIRDLRGLAPKGPKSPENQQSESEKVHQAKIIRDFDSRFEEENEEIQEPWRAHLKVVGKRGRQLVLQREQTAQRIDEQKHRALREVYQILQELKMQRRRELDRILELEDWLNQKQNQLF